MSKPSPKARNRRSTEELQRASLAVQYEVLTLATTYDLLQELRADWGSNERVRAQSNALVHAFLLAARNLLGFLYSYNPGRDDIIAEDFFDNPNEWRANRPTPEAELADGGLRRQISKRLAHLTWDRAQRTKPLWGAFRIVWNIGSVLQSFLQLVPDEKVHAQLREDVALIMMRLRAHAEYYRGDMAPCSILTEFDDVAHFDREPESEGRA